MSYPQALLPHPSRKQITCDLTGRYLIRRTDVADPNVLRDANTGLVKDEFICDHSTHLTDLSTSLLGIFTPDHNRIYLTGPNKGHYGGYCLPNELIDPAPQEGQDYVINQDAGFIVIPIDQLNGLKINFKREDVELPATCQVEHTSTRWNFWHYSIRWQVPDEFLHDAPPKELKKGWAKNLLSTARALIATHADTALPEIAPLAQGCYQTENEEAVVEEDPAE
jgi:hypothetical protein